MRGVAMFAVGVVAMIAALCFVAAVAVYASRHAPEPAQAPPVVPTATPEPAEELERKENLPVPKKEKRVVAKTGGRQAPSPGQAPPPEPAPPEPVSVEEPWLKPAADTVTLVAVRTCDGTQLRLNAAEKEMYDLHNETRAKYGLGSLCVSAGLTSAARAHSQDMLNRGYFSHYSPEGLAPEDRVERLGFPIGESYGAGENITLGDDMNGDGSPEERFEALMDSPGHRANILDGDYQEIGLGAVRDLYTNDDYGYDETPATAYTIDFGLRY